MKLLWRAGILLLCLAILGIGTALAQDDATDEPTQTATEAATEESSPAPTEESTAEPVATAEATAEATIIIPAEVPLAVDGSPSMARLMQTLVDGYTADSGEAFNLEISTEGPNEAFERFCRGELGLVMSTRPITDAEEKACADNGVEFIENLVAYQGLVFLMSPGVQTTLTCVSLGDMESVFGLGGEGTKFNVQTLSPADPATELDVFGPAPETLGREILTSLLPGGEVRTDYTTYEDAATLIDTLTTTPGIAALTYEEFSKITDLKGAVALQVRNDETGDCIDPSLTTMEVGTYEAFRPQLLYISMVARQNSTIRDFLTFINDIEKGAIQLVSEAGYTAASEPSYARSENNLVIPTTGRTFSRPTSPVVVSTTETGTVNFAGTAAGARVINELTASFTGEFTAATLNANFAGTAPAFEALCSGQADVILVDRAPTEEEQAKCAEQNIELVEAHIGTEALVFLVRADNNLLPACVSISELATAFAAPTVQTAETSAEATAEATEAATAEATDEPSGPVNWNELNPSYGDVPLTVFAPGASTLETGWLFAEAGLPGAYVRSADGEYVFYPPASFDNPNMYNAAAVANYEGGGLTVVYWSDYQNSEHRDNLRPLAAGENCIVPDETTIADSTYPFTTPLTLYFSKANMGQPIVGAFMWSLISENTLERIASLNLAISNIDELRTQRDTFFDLIQEAQELAAQQAAEATPEATANPDATADANATPEAEATAEPSATEEATQAATPEADATESSN